MTAAFRNWTPLENEFFAENELIEIIPNFKGPKFSFVSGTFGPFKPSKPIQVPLWLAVYLKQRKKCIVQVPNWMNIEFLNRVKLEDRESNGIFSEAIPYYYFEMANLLFTECGDEFKELAKTKSVIEDIHEYRKEMLINKLKKVEPETPIQFLSHVSAAELNAVRPAFTAVYSVVNKMQQIREKADAQQN